MINVPQSHSLWHLNIWFSVGGPVWESLGSMDLLEYWPLGVGFDNVKIHAISSIFSNLLVCDLRCKLSAAAFCHLLLLSAIPGL